MKLKTKIHLYTSLSLLILLILVHTAVYLIFSSALTSKDAARLADETDNIAEALRAAETEGVALQDMLQAYLPANGMVRVVNGDQKAVMTITKEKAYKDFPLSFHSGETADVRKHDGKLFAEAAVPVIWTDGQVVSLQLVERLENTEESLFLLKIILIAASAAVCIASFFAGSLLARRIINPIRRLMITMKDIQRDKEFKTISLEGQSNDELYQMGLTFNEMAMMLKEHYDKQQQFVQDASHELKTPLTIIESYSSLMKRWGAKKPEVLEESIEAIHSEAVHMKKLTNQLLALAKSHQELELDLKTIDLIEAARAVMQTLQPVYQRDILLETDKESLLVKADEERIKQLLTILLDNAIKYSEKPIEMSAGTRNGRPFLSVRDEGIGIPEEHIPHLFERFYRADEARNRKTGGTGLGLSIAKQIADEHGIELSVKSKPGQGTAVTMQFSEQNGGLMTKTIKIVSFAAAAILVVIICTFLIIRQTHENVLSKETVVKKVEASYEGKVTKATQSKDKKTYDITLENPKGTYFVKADAISADILSMNRVKAVNPSAMTEKEAEHLALERVPGTVKKQTRQSRVATYTIQKEDGKTYEVKVDMQAKTVLSADQISSKDQQKTPITKKEAKTIAERKTGGTADDADLEESEGTLIFEVDVDLPDNKEATVKINAYTGKVANIVYED